MFMAPATPRGRSARQRAIRSSRQHYDHTAVLEVIATATDDDVSAGREWYHDAHERAATLAYRYGLTVRQASGVIAALSPNTGWAENLRLAEEACEHAYNGRTDLIGGHFEDACVKASRILQGADPDKVLGGRKVRSFFRNILEPTRQGPVTVDRHAIGLLTADPSGHKTRVLERVGVYVEAAAAFRSAGRLVGLRPHEAQAVAWIVWRRQHGVSDAHDPE